MKILKTYFDLHLIETQSRILFENKHKSGIYMIQNLINGHSYVGSASSNRIHVRFRNHFFHFSGSRLTCRAIQKHGIQNFSFSILEYYPGLILKENLSKHHIKLLELETHYIQLVKPKYNILQYGTSSLHTPETIQKRRQKISEKFKGVPLSQERKDMLSKIAKLRNENLELKQKLRLSASKPVILYKKNGKIHSRYPSIRSMAKEFGCCNKTINKTINNKGIFKKIGIIKLDQKDENES